MWLKKNWSTMLLLLIMLIGIGILAYPTFSDWWNSFHQSRAIAGYSERVANINDARYKQLMEAAHKYNDELREMGDGRFSLTDEQRKEYNEQLNVAGLGIMGYVDIPKINITLPVYHGTSESVLQIAVGHIEGSSLPVGGVGTHAVISGHRGLPSAKLFTDLDKLQEGDTFQLTVLDEVLTYQIDQIRIVLPNELEELAIDPKQDYCTMVTCTPYGINSHRMLVRGHRIDNPDAGDVRVTSDATQIEPLHVLPVVFGIFIGVLLIGFLISSHNQREDLKAYRAATKARHDREMDYSEEYYYKRHPDRRPKPVDPKKAAALAKKQAKKKGKRKWKEEVIVRD